MSPAMPVATSGQPCEDPGAGKGRSGGCSQCGHQARPMPTCRLGAWNLLDLSATLVQLRGEGPRGPPLGETILHFRFQESFPSAQWSDHFLQKRETAHFGDGGLQAFVFSSVKARVIMGLRHGVQERVHRAPWWLGGKESAYRCRRRGLHPSSGKIPQAAEQQSRPATTTEPVL